jgi:hypothetical protein
LQQDSSVGVPVVNAYVCDTCGLSTITVDRVKGVTPMFMKCRASAGCGGRAASQMYRCDQSLEPTHEWYRPSVGEQHGMDSSTLAHVRSGGLLLREIRLDRDSPAARLARVKGWGKGRRF